MLELKLPETGTGPYPYKSGDFQYELLLNLECVGLAGGSGDRIHFSMNLTNPTNPNPIADAWEYVLQKSILEEDGYCSIEKSEYLSDHEKKMKKSSFVTIHTMKPLVDLVMESIREESGKLLLSGSENIANSYYAHRDLYVLPAISGVGIVDIRAGTCPGYFVRAFCSDEIDNARKERMKKRVFQRFIKSKIK